MLTTLIKEKMLWSIQKEAKMVLLLLRTLMWPINLFLKEVRGLENIPKKQFILASNHQSYLDPALLLYLVARKRNKKIRFFATNDPKWKNWFWNFWWDYVGAIRINGALDKGLKAANEGDCLGVFPAGELTRDGRIQKDVHKGLGVLALKTGLPVVPVTLNTFWWWNRYRKLPNFKRNIKVHIGKPMKFDMKYTEKNAMKVVNKVMKRIKENA